MRLSSLDHIVTEKAKGCNPHIQATEEAFYNALAFSAKIPLLLVGEGLITKKKRSVYEELYTFDLGF